MYSLVICGDTNPLHLQITYCTFSHRSLTQLTFPDIQARCKGVDPKWSAFCKLAPEYIRSLMTSTCPLYADQCSAVSPLMSTKLFKAPIPNKKAAVAVLPNMHAVINGVKPLKSAALTATPAWRSTWTTAACPFLQAQCMGLGPCVPRQDKSMGAFLSTKYRMISTLPSSAVQWAGV